MAKNPDKEPLVIDVPSEPIGAGDTEKLSETAEIKPKKRDAHGEVHKKEVAEKIQQGEELSGADKQEKKEEQEQKEKPRREEIIEPSRKEKEGRLEKEVSIEDRIDALCIAKQGIESKLSKAEDPEEKQRLLKEKKEMADMIIDYAAQLPEFKNIKEEIKKEQDSDWEQAIMISGYKNLRNYKDWHEKSYLIEEVKNSETLSDDQKDQIMQGKNVIVGGWFRNFELSGGQVAICLKAGIDVNQIRRKSWWNPLTKRIRVNGMNFKNKEEFEKYLAKEEQRVVMPEVEKRMEKRKQEIIEKSSEPIIDNKIDKIIERLQAGSKEISVSEKIKLFDYLSADLDRAKKIDIALKKNKKLMIESGKILNPEIQRSEMEDMSEYLSNEIIRIAERLSGRDKGDLVQEAALAPGYDFDKEQKKQKVFRKWITLEIEKILKNTREELKGAKVKKGTKLKPLKDRQEYHEE